MTTAKFRDLGDFAYEVEHLSRQIWPMVAPLLKGRGPEVQSAVLADLTSMWLAGCWPPEAREELLALFVKLVRDFVPQSESKCSAPAAIRPGANKKAARWAAP